MSPDSKPNRGLSPSCGSDGSIRTRKTGLDCRIHHKEGMGRSGYSGPGGSPWSYHDPVQGQGLGLRRAVCWRLPVHAAPAAAAAGRRGAGGWPRPGRPPGRSVPGPGSPGPGPAAAGRLAGVSSAVQSRGRPGGKQGGAQPEHRRAFNLNFPGRRRSRMAAGCQGRRPPGRRGRATVPATPAAGRHVQLEVGTAR
jgi:hypothetical protein